MTRILLIAPCANYRKELISHINKNYDNIEIVEYDPVSKRVPALNFPWEDYDLVIMDHDLGLGKENGLGWMLHFNSITMVPSVLMLTSVEDKRLASMALKTGAVDFIDKEDVSAESLATALNEIFALNNKQFTLNSNQKYNQDFTAGTAKDTAQLPDFLFQEEEPTQTNNNQSSIVVPGYEILEEIGEGGMSTVFLAKPIESDIKVALKIMFTEGNEDPLALKRFMQEYTLISCLNHANVVRIYERAFASDFAYIAMEYFQGGDLTKKLAMGIDTATAIDYTRQMCQGLIAVHDLNIIHRDIKPGNVLFKEDGTLTIIDFGVAKDLTRDTDITVINHIIGTPYYISPEQASGLQSDHRGDLYSLGIMMYQMLTNKRPYIAKSVPELMNKHRNAPIPKLPSTLAAYQPLIDGLLAKKPEDRFQSAQDVLAGLDQIQ